MLPAVEAQNVTAQTYLGETYGGITNCYFYLQEKKKCLTASQRTVAIWEKLARENPRVPVYQSMAAMSLNNLGQHLNLNGQNKEAQQALQQAIDVGQKGLSMDPNMGSLAFAVAQAYGTRGDFFLDDSHFQEAAADAEKAVSYMNLAIQKGNDPNCRLYIGNYYFVLGTAQSKLGQREKAQATWIQGPLVWENYMKENPTNVGFKDRVAEKLLYLALAQGEAGLPEEMHGSWQRSMQLGAEVIGAKPEDLAFRTKLASLSHECATFLLRKDQPKEALPAVQKAIELQLVVCEKKPDSAKDGELLATFRSTLAAAQAKRPK
jgi:tetratricopeptide (TPR) repeat protein